MKELEIKVLAFVSQITNYFDENSDILPTCMQILFFFLFFRKQVPNHNRKETRPAWAGFKTAKEGRAKIYKFLWQKLKNKSNIEKHIMNNFITLLELF